MEIENLKMQTLATANNYTHTGQFNKALGILNQLSKVLPDDPLVKSMTEIVVKTNLMQSGFSLIAKKPEINFVDLFGKFWEGESLAHKSITVFCDQGIGDVLNMLRYLKLMKQKWNCEIRLNCYAYFQELKSLVNQLDFVDVFENEFTKTDYHTNILSIGVVINSLDCEFNYPAHFKRLNKTEIPSGKLIFDAPPINLGPKIGIAWESNPKNYLFENKSIPLDLFQVFDQQFCSLLPRNIDCDFLVQPQITCLLDTVQLIYGLDLVISVDTAVLHLAGILGKKTIGLLGKSPDPRWGESTTTVWYDSVQLYRFENSWEDLLSTVKQELHNV